MNDRFKFRVWDKANKRYGCFYHDFYISEDGELHINPNQGGDWLTPAGEDYIKEQCTGLKDKNGKLIYDGDILKSKKFKILCECDGDKDTGAVIWNDINGAFQCESFTLMYNAHPSVFDSMEIIGNIHEEVK